MKNQTTPTSTPASPTPAPLFTQEKSEQNYEATQQRHKFRTHGQSSRYIILLF